MDKLGIVLATYNEAANLPRLIEGLEGLPLTLRPRIYVVDDNSPDDTSGIAQRLAAHYGNIFLIIRPGKFGLGSAIRRGIRAALDEGCTRIVTMDADLSHDPEDVPRLLRVADEGDTDLVQASRYVKGGGTANLGPLRRLQGRTANLLCRWLLGSTRDATTNFRVFSERAARLVMSEAKGRDFEFQPECLLIAKRHGLQIVEVPIIFSGRAGGRSKLGPMQYWRWLLFFIREAVGWRGRSARPSPPA